MKYFLLLISGALLLNACSKKNECTSTAGNSIAPDAEKTRVTNYLNANPDPAAVQLENSGLYYSISNAGSSKKPTQCSRVEIKYVGKNENGSIFDQTLGTSTRTFSLSGLIEGWKRGMPLIGEGGKIRLYVPPALAYGPGGLIDNRTGAVIIPPNQIIIFDIELVAVR